MDRAIGVFALAASGEMTAKPLRTSQGVIDPAKVVRCALQDASSIAGLLITTEAMVAERPKKEAAHAPMPHGAMDY